MAASLSGGNLLSMRVSKGALAICQALRTEVDGG